jgi:putative ABC transport system permease protein
MSTALVAFRLARRELRGGIGGFRVFLACLTLGVGAIAAVGSIAAAVLAGLAADGASILGGDVSLRSIQREITDDQRAWLATRGPVSRATHMRAMARAETGPARSLIEFKAIDGNYPLYGEIVYDPPLAPPLDSDRLYGRRDGVWGATADRSLLTRLGIGLGGRVRVGSATYEIRAVIEREPDRASGARAFTIGPRFMVSDASVAETGLIRPGSQVWYLYRLRLAEGTSIAQWRADLDAAFPDAPWFVRDRSDGSPQLRRFVDRTTLFMTLVGLTALLVGGVGVGNAVGSYLSGKRTTIATLKCLGATRGVIFATYLTLVMAMTALGIAIGLAIGSALPMLAAGLMSEMLPMAARIGIYPAPLLMAAAFGVLTALAFSLWPIARACELPAGSLFRDLAAPTRRWPRPLYVGLCGAAIAGLIALAILGAEDRRFAMWFVLGAAGSLAVFRGAGYAVAWAARRAGSVRRPTLRLALANLHRPGAPTASIVVALGLGLTVMVAVALIEGNLRNQITENLPVRAPAFFFVDIQPDQAAAFRTAVREVDQAAEIESVPMLRGRITAINGVPAEKVKTDGESDWVLRGDRGITWRGAEPAGADIVAGKWWPADYSGPPLVSFDARAAQSFGVGVGDTLTVNILGRDITARIANLQRHQWGTLRMNFVVVLSPGAVENAPQTNLATVRLTPSREARLERTITDRFTNVTAIRVRDVLETVGEILSRLGGAIRITAGITILSGTLVLAGAVAAGHRRRVYDAVVLKVLGATRRDVLGAYLIEFGLLGLATSVIAAVLGTFAGAIVVTELMHFDWVFLPAVVVVTTLICIALTLAFGFFGTWRALGQRAAPLLRNE